MEHHRLGGSRVENAFKGSVVICVVHEERKREENGAAAREFYFLARGPERLRAEEGARRAGRGKRANERPI